MTFCGAFQLSVVKVRLVLSTVPSLMSLLSKLTVTSAVGPAAKRTLNVAVPPASVVGPLIAETMYPAVSLSMLMTSKLACRNAP